MKDKISMTILPLHHDDDGIIIQKNAVQFCFIKKNKNKKSKLQSTSSNSESVMNKMFQYQCNEFWILCHHPNKQQYSSQSNE